MDFEKFKKEIEIYLNEINLQIEKEQKEQLYKFMKLLIEWNNKINLTAITEESEIILKHFIDSIIIEKHINSTDSIIDIGTGAGFPGLPLKIVKPGNKILLMDSLGKRIKFLEEVINELKIKKIKAIHMRVEEAGKNKEYRENFDIATSRAVSKLNVLAEYMLPLIKIGGQCICLKGPNVKDEINEAKKTIKILGGNIEKVEELMLPKSDINRNIIIIRKISKTPNKYPRKAGIPSVRPI